MLNTGTSVFNYLGMRNSGIYKGPALESLIASNFHQNQQICHLAQPVPSNVHHYYWCNRQHLITSDGCQSHVRGASILNWLSDGQLIDEKWARVCSSLSGFLFAILTKLLLSHPRKTPVPPRIRTGQFVTGRPGSNNTSYKVVHFQHNLVLRTLMTFYLVFHDKFK